jgi:exosortase
MEADAEIPIDHSRVRAPDWGSIVRSPAFVPGVVLATALAIGFWPLFRLLPSDWLETDGYMSHGFLVPLISGYVIYRWWPRLRTIPVKGSFWALPVLLLFLYVTWAGDMTDLRFVLSFMFVGVVVAGTWFVAGRRWALATALPACYLLFALPIWTFAIDRYTSGLQQLSTRVSFHMLALAGYTPVMADTNVIALSHYQFEVALACSGFKLLTAVTAFTVFFALIGSLRWWANLAMLALVLPLCLFINGLRVALIGVVGETWGDGAAHSFHDWSGYITLLICFFLLFKFARWLGWKD